ncbi:type II secretion system GspH family protein [Synergistaceae bacterium OttesenSCG-928-I11]|nr:type II secretion system GspH family protein [Synergistaceae bacterium OttesenSCG-928-I11]
MMRKIMHARKGGFTLVELLIVIMIIAILAGMMMLATGAATDSAEATKIINDMRSLKSAILLYYVDNQEWPSPIPAGGLDLYGTAWGKSIDKYMDRPLLGDKIYNVRLYPGADTYTGRTMMRIDATTIANKTTGNGVFLKLLSNATSTGVLKNSSGAAYDGAKVFYLVLR